MLQSSTYQAEDLTLGQESNTGLAQNVWEGWVLKDKLFCHWKGQEGWQGSSISDDDCPRLEGEKP